MKRRSAKSESRAQPDPLTYFTDRDLAKQFPQILRDAGLEVVGYNDPQAFPDDPKITDRAWIRFACGRGWICLTHDRATHRDDTLDEVFADWQPSGALFLLRGGIPTVRLAEMFLAGFPAIERLIRKQRKLDEPFIGVVRRMTVKGGREETRVERRYDRAGWLLAKQRRLRPSGSQ